MSTRWISLYRADQRRLWTPRYVRTGLWLLLAMLALQVGIGLMLQQAPRLGVNAVWNWAFYVTSALGLNDSWTLALQSQLGMHAGPVRTIWATPGSLWPVILMGIASVPLLVLAPAAAALSVAPDRESRRTDELLLAGFTPLDMLLGKGLAALAPFLALHVALQLTQLLMMGLAPSHGITGVTGTEKWLTLLEVVGLRMLSFATLAALMVCISGACRRQRNALATCYAALFAGRVISQALVFAPWSHAIQQPGRGLLNNGVVLGLQVVATLVVGHLALRALAEPDAAGRSKPRSHPIMEYGAEVE